MKGKFSSKGQSTLEYAILILIVIVALLAMQTYLKRGVQGRMRETSENIGQAYSPGYTTSTFDTIATSNSEEIVDGAAQTTHTDLINRDEDRTGNEKVDVYANEYWP